MLPKYVPFVPTMFALLLFASASQADLLHEGDNDPETEGWSRNGTEGVADATGKPNWRQVYGSGSNYYRVIGTHPANGSSPIEQLYLDPTGWTATAELHLLEGAFLNEAIFLAQDATNHFHIQLYDGLGITPKGAYAYWQSGIFADNAMQIGTVDPTDGFHTYQIVLDPGADTGHVFDEAEGLAGRTDDIISYYIDGVKELEVARATLPYTPDRAEMVIGRTGGANNPGGADAQSTDLLNALIRLEPGRHPIDPIGPPTGDLLGDYNNSGAVDAADYTLYRDNLGLDSSVLQNNDIAGNVDVGHYTQWSQNFNATSTGSSAAIPEPASLVLMLLIGPAAFALRHRSMS